MSREQLRQQAFQRQQQQASQSRQQRQQQRKTGGQKSAIAGSRTIDNKVEAIFPDGGKANADLTFNASYQPGGTYPVSQSANGKTYLHNRSHVDPVPDDEDVKPVDEPVIRWLDALSYGPFNAPGYNASKIEIRLCGEDVGPRVIATINGPVYDQNSFSYVMFPFPSEERPKWVFGFDLQLTGSGPNDWVVHYVETLYVSGNTSSNYVFDVFIKRITPDTPDSDDHQVIYTLPRIVPGGYANPYYNPGKGYTIERYPNTLDDITIPERYYIHISNDGSYTEDIGFFNYGYDQPLGPGGRQVGDTFTTTYKTYFLPRYDLERTTVDTVIVGGFFPTSTWTSGEEWWYYSGHTTNTNKTLAYNVGGLLSLVTEYPKIRRVRVAFVYDGSQIVTRELEDIINDCVNNSDESYHTTTFWNDDGNLTNITTLISGWNVWYYYPCITNNNIVFVGVKNGFTYTENESVDAPLEQGETIFFVFDKNLAFVEAVRVDFTKPRSFEFTLTGEDPEYPYFNTGISPTPSIWLPDYSE